MAVAGGTGLVGPQTVTALRQARHDAVILTCSVGVDLATGTGWQPRWWVSMPSSTSPTPPTIGPEQARAFFATTTGQLAAAEDHPGVSQYVVLSIVGVGWVEGDAHNAGKRAQERVAPAGPVPATIVRAT